MLMAIDAAEASTDPGAKAKPKRVIKQRQSLSEKQTGTTIFPISRIKKICKADKDLDILTSEATFMVSVATVSCCLRLTPCIADSVGIFHQTFHGGGMYES
jgi:hypothetical protein